MKYTNTKEIIPNAKSQNNYMSHKSLAKAGMPIFAVGYLLVGLFTMQIPLDFMKRCPKCGQVKNRIEFSKNKTRKDGLQNRCKKYKNQYYQEHKEDLNKQGKQWKKEHEEECLAYNKLYNQEHKEEKSKYNKQYRQEHKKEMSKNQNKYHKTEKGKISLKRAWTKRKKNYSFNPLNEAFEGSVWHHINDVDVVAIPENIHLKYSGYKTEKHRKLILEYYGSLENMVKKEPVCDSKGQGMLF